MNWVALLGALIATVNAAPQAYKYEDTAPVLNQNSFKSIGLPKVLWCKHINHNIQDASSLALINSQSEGRIVNHKNNYETNHNFVAAASGYIPQTLSTPLDTIPFNQFPSEAHNGESLTAIDTHTQHFSENGQQQATSIQMGHGYSYNQAPLAINAHGPGLQLSQTAPISIKPNTNTHSLLSANPNLAPGIIGNSVASRPVHTFLSGSSAYPHISGTYAHEIDHSSGGSASISHNQNIQEASKEIHNFGTHGVNHATNNLDLNVAALNGQLGNVIRETFASATLDPSAEKHVYVHIPPEDFENNNSQIFINQQQPPTSPKKHYKIIFIKAPSYQAPNYNQLAAAVAPQVEEKTIVYVLVKKPEVPSLEQIQQSSYKSGKPEVYFIKYKTRKEGDSSLNSYNSQNRNEIIKTQSTDNHPIENGSGLIDIRSGAEGNALSSSTSYSSPAIGVSNEPKHELYGVPLQ